MLDYGYPDRNREAKIVRSIFFFTFFYGPRKSGPRAGPKKSGPSYLGEHVRWTFEKASKEHALEKSLEKMQEDWEDILFNLLPYRDTDINILGGMDELQILLDDQLIKCQG